MPCGSICSGKDALSHRRIYCYASQAGPKNDWPFVVSCYVFIVMLRKAGDCARAQDQRSLSASSPFLMVFAKFSAHWALSTEGVLLGP